MLPWSVESVVTPLLQWRGSITQCRSPILELNTSHKPPITASSSLLSRALIEDSMYVRPPMQLVKIQHHYNSQFMVNLAAAQGDSVLL